MCWWLLGEPSPTGQCHLEFMNAISDLTAHIPGNGKLLVSVLARLAGFDLTPQQYFSHLSTQCSLKKHNNTWHFGLHIDGLMQERRNFIANALELRLSCTYPSIWYEEHHNVKWYQMLQVKEKFCRRHVRMYFTAKMFHFDWNFEFCSWGPFDNNSTLIQVVGCKMVILFRPQCVELSIRPIRMVLYHEKTSTYCCHQYS